MSAGSQTETSARIFGLDLLRAVAIVGVLAAHSAPFLSDNLGARISYFSPGHFGVDLFFVLSGFLIGSILLRDLPEIHTVRGLRNFWYRRWMRTLPNYFLFLVVNVVVFSSARGKLPDNYLPYLTFTQNVYWPRPEFFPESWSLAVEEWFYLSFPLLLFLGLRWLKLGDKAFLITAAIFLMLPTTLRVHWVLVFDGSETEGIRTVMLLRLDALMFGVLAAWIKGRSPNQWQRARIGALVAGSILLLLAFAIMHKTDFAFLRRTLPYTLIPLGFALCLPFFDQWQVRKENLFTLAVRMTALWSYSLYLCNLRVARHIRRNVVGNEPSIIDPDLFRLAVFLGGCFVISAVVYTYFEKPLMALRNKPEFLPQRMAHWIRHAYRYPAPLPATPTPEVPRTTE